MGVSSGYRGHQRSPHLGQVIADLDAMFVIDGGEFDDHVESPALLSVATALRHEFVGKGCSDSKGSWNTY